jgi:hypothetical protein
MKQLSLTSLFANVGASSTCGPMLSRKTSGIELKLTSSAASEARADQLKPTTSKSSIPVMSPASTPPAAPEGGIELQRKPHTRATAPVPPKRQKHIKTLKDGLPPLDVHSKLEIARRTAVPSDVSAEAASAAAEAAVPPVPVPPAAAAPAPSAAAQGGGADAAFAAAAEGVEGAGAGKKVAAPPVGLLPGVRTNAALTGLGTYVQPAEYLRGGEKRFEQIDWPEIEYEMDGADEQWLSTRRSLLDENGFEFLIDRIEKLKANCNAGADIGAEKLQQLASGQISAEAVEAVVTWWRQKRAEVKDTPLLRRLRPQTDFDEFDPSKVFRPGRRPRNMRERQAVSYRDMSNGDIQRLQRAESAAQVRKLSSWPARTQRRDQGAALGGCHSRWVPHRARGLQARLRKEAEKKQRALIKAHREELARKAAAEAKAKAELRKRKAAEVVAAAVRLVMSRGRRGGPGRGRRCR